MRSLLIFTVMLCAGLNNLPAQTRFRPLVQGDSLTLGDTVRFLPSYSGKAIEFIVTEWVTVPAVTLEKSRVTIPAHNLMRAYSCDYMLEVRLSPFQSMTGCIYLREGDIYMPGEELLLADAQAAGNFFYFLSAFADNCIWQIEGDLWVISR